MRRRHRGAGGNGPRGRHCMVVYSEYPLGEIRVQREAEALSDAGFAVDVICLRGAGTPAHEIYRGIQIHRLPVRRHKQSLARQLLSYIHFFVLATVRLTRLHLRHRYRSVQVHNLPDFLVFCAVLPKLQRVPIILDLHDLMPEFFAGRFGANRRGALAQLILWQERLSCRFADHVVTVSEHWRQALIRRGVPASKCSVVMNVADERIFGARDDRLPSRAEFRLIYHGTVTHRYGLDLAVRAVALVRDEIPEIRLTILGKGDLMPTLVELRRELGVEDHVELRDELVLAVELPEILSSAHLGIVPYRNDVFTDGLLPTKLMEYAVAGIPCIASRTTAIDAYFRDTMVVFFQPDDVEDLAQRILELHHDRSRLALLASKSASFTERYNWTRIGAEYVSLVAGLGATLSGRSGRSARPAQPAPQ